MADSLSLLYERLIDQTPIKFHRSLYNEFNLKSRLTGLVGPRGVGKTTLILQYIKEQLSQRNDVFYFSADHIYFNQTSVYDYVERLYLHEGIRVVFIDEIHRYKNWSQEIKNLYDGFPDLYIIFSGSSSLDLIKGSYDLSRRAKMLHLPGLSFREYLNYRAGLSVDAVDMETLIKFPKKLGSEISQIPKLLGYFKEYLKQGYYPFEAADSLDYSQRVLRVIEKTIDEDIANFYKLKTENLFYFRKILTFLASIPPGEISINNLAQSMGVDAKTITNYLIMLDATGLTHSIYSVEVGNKGLTRPTKVFLNNTTLLYALESTIGSQVHTGTMRELFFIQMVKNAKLDIFHSKAGDYSVNGRIFEIGGKNKKHTQIKDIENAFIVKDDSLIASYREIPLVYFGFLY
ncbi:MAG: ATP-binding protein [Nitrososphaerales archaeon]